MRFGISDLLWTTTAVALLFALLRTGFAGFLIAFLILNLLQFFFPIVVLVTTIAFADQRGQMLDISTNPAWRILKTLWLLSFICTIIVWGLLFLLGS
ncbi:MAG: hypothetical protein SGI77_07355 [Pirellulaceae bacterium]|nr:hypothetical protein [Pirellulaceae bacterium]